MASRGLIVTTKPAAQELRVYLSRPSPRTPNGRFPLPGVQGAHVHLGTPHLAATAPAIGAVDLSVDTEGRGKDGLIRYELNCVQVATEDDCWIFDPRDENQRELLNLVLRNARSLTFHNSAHDVHIMYVNGLFSTQWLPKVYDTLIWARLALPDELTNKGLASCAQRYLNVPVGNPIAAVCKTLRWTQAQWYQNADLNIPAYRNMAASDAVLLARLRKLIRKAAHSTLTENHPFASTGRNRALNSDEAWELVDREQVINRIHLKRQCFGLLIDPEYAENYRSNGAPRMREIVAELENEHISPGNSASMVGWMDARGLLPAGYPRTKEKKQPSGSAENMERLNHPMVDIFLEHKRFTKVADDYLKKALDARDAEGRIRCGTNVLVAATGRMSISGDLPLQQLPAAARGVILAEPGSRMTSLDWSQIEPVIVANIAGDLAALEYYESGKKFYDALVTDQISYDEAKTVLLAGLYGQGIKSLAHKMNMNIEDAQWLQKALWRMLPGSWKLAGRGGVLQNMAEQYQQIMTISGRIIPVPHGNWGVAVHKGVNFYVQGSAYDVLAETELEIYRQGLDDAVYLAFHDELITDEAAAPDIQRIMETPPAWLVERAGRVPVLRTSRKDLGIRWGK